MDQQEGSTDQKTENVEQDKQPPKQNTSNPYADKSQYFRDVSYDDSEPKRIKAPRNLKATLFIVVSIIVLLSGGALAYTFAKSEVTEIRGIGTFVTFVNSILGIDGESLEPPGPLPPEIPPQPPVIPPAVIDGWKSYVSSEYEFSFKYPEEATFFGPGNFGIDSDAFTAVFLGQNQSGGQISIDEDLEDGYIMRVIPFKDVQNRDVDQLAIQKRNTYLARCPGTAKISNIEGRAISEADAVTFTVQNCNQNYVESFLIKGTTLFNFLQVYKGDIGYDQVYLSATEEIISKFRFTNIITPSPQSTWLTYGSSSRAHAFEFKYPSELNQSCCTVDGPLSNEAVKLIVLADPDSVSDGEGKRFNGFGVYNDPNTFSVDFGTYMENQKRLFAENYRIIVGRDPEERSEDIIKVGGVDAALLKGYAWWGDMLYVPVPDGKSIIIFSKTELNKGEMDQLFNDILATFKFSPIQ